MDEDRAVRAIIGWSLRNDQLWQEAAKPTGDYLQGLPALPPESRQNLDRLRTGFQLWAHEKWAEVVTTKKSPSGSGLGPYLSCTAQGEIGSVIVSAYARIYRELAEEFIALGLVAGDPGAFFERLSDACFSDSLRTFRSVTDGAWFQHTSDEEDDSVEPRLIHLVEALTDRFEPIRRAATVAALKARLAVKAEEQPLTPQPPLSIEVQESLKPPASGVKSDEQTSASTLAENHAVPFSATMPQHRREEVPSRELPQPTASALDDRHRVFVEISGRVIKQIGIEAFLGENKGVSRTAITDYRAGKIGPGKMSSEKRRQVEDAITASASRLNLLEPSPTIGPKSFEAGSRQDNAPT